MPRYYEVIKKPMDLAKIKSKLETINYDSVYDFVDDIKLMFDNCYSFNSVSFVFFLPVEIEIHDFFSVCTLSCAV